MKTSNKHDLLLRSFKLTDRLVGTHAHNGAYVTVSPSCRKITGYTKKEILGRSFKEFSHPDDLKYVDRMMRSSQNPDNTVLNEYRFRKKNGTYAWFQTQAFTMPGTFQNGENLVTITRDVTDIRNFDPKAAFGSNFAKASEELAAMGSWSLTVADREMAWSKNLYALTESEADRLPNLPDFLSFFPEHDAKDLVKHLEQSINSGAAFSLQLSFTTARKKQLHVKVAVKPAVERGKVTKLFGIVQDITSFVESEQSLKNVILDITAQKKYLLEYNQIITHNVKGPINSLSSLISFIDTSESVDEKMMFLDKIGKVADSIRDMLDSLTLSTRQLGQERIMLEPLTVSASLRDVLTWLEGTIDTTKAVIKYSGSWDELQYNKVYLESILLNLLENAIKYRSLKRRPIIKITTFMRGQVKYLTLEDNGSGINLDKFGDKIFQMHETFHKDRRGNGIGLFMIRNQIEAMGGQIRAESLVGKGTKFTIAFNKPDISR